MRTIWDKGIWAQIITTKSEDEYSSECRVYKDKQQIGTIDLDAIENNDYAALSIRGNFDFTATSEQADKGSYADFLVSDKAFDLTLYDLLRLSNILQSLVEDSIQDSKLWVEQIKTTEQGQ